MINSKLKSGEFLMKSSKVSELEFKIALEIQKNREKKLNIPYVNLDEYKINLEIATIISENLVRKYELIGIDKKDGVLIVAMVDPLNIFALEDLEFFLKMKIKPVMSNRKNILNLIDKFYSCKETENVLEEFKERYTPINLEELEEEGIEIASAPIVKLVNSIIEQAVKERASDIHIEPSENYIRIRFRIDGDLRKIMELPNISLSAIITRIKIIGEMNIAEKRISQDGRVEGRINDKDVDMRISTLPTIYGEKIVIRLLDRTSFMFTKETLGFNKKDLKRFDKILRQPYGMILVTGPTGSGKSTTLYTVLQDLNKVNKNIITIEDPIEYKLEGINQVQVNLKAGLTFSSGLRSVLRQDPDIVMLGEIRDSDTAKTAIRASITGHLVISTLHTNDSPSTVARLIDMGIESHLVSSAVIGIISQRLVKLLCTKCKKKYEACTLEKKLLGIDENKELILNKPKGCSSCNNGYNGRFAVYELMLINKKIRKLIDSNSNVDELRNSAIEDGMTTLLESTASLAIKGDTSYEEVLRIGFTLEQEV